MASMLPSVASAMPGYVIVPVAANAKPSRQMFWLVLARYVWGTHGIGSDIPEQVPWGFHNLFVAAVILLISAWAAKVAYQLLVLAVLHRRLAFHPALQLNRMSIYAKDFQQLIRQHLNQILRMRRTVPWREASRHMLAAHLQPESLQAVGAGSRLGLTFTVDALEACRARLYWGVSVTACDGLLQQARSLPSHAPLPSSAGSKPMGLGHTAMELPRNFTDSGPSAASLEHPLIEEDGNDFFGASGCALQSRPVHIPAGERQRCILHESDFVDSESLGFDLSASWSTGDHPAENESIVPLVIVVSSASSRRTDASTSGSQLPVAQVRHQATLVKFRREDREPTWHPEVLHQVAISEGSAHRLLGIYGFEDDEDADCKICYDRPRSVLLLPCRHCAVCSSCLRSLRDERCPLCRATFSAYLLFPLNRSPPEAQATSMQEVDAEHEEASSSGAPKSTRRELSA